MKFYLEDPLTNSLDLTFGGKSIMSHALVLSRVVILVYIACMQHTNLFSLVNDFGFVNVLIDLT